jgi:protein-disulfide isomerase
MTDAAVEGLVKRDAEEARSMGATGTPVLIMNGIRLRGAIPARDLDSLIELTLRGKALRP